MWAQPTSISLPIVRRRRSSPAHLQLHSGRGKQSFLLRIGMLKTFLQMGAASSSRGTTWQKTAQAYMASFQRARVERMLGPRPALQDLVAAKATDQLPLLNTSHLSQMTDDTGMLQHAIYSIPYCNEGYTTDDNARALIVSTMLN